ncbi:MAG: fused MFS/spermidine synthase [Anaerolineae bacterium]|nr:fused MFS/spermidine synthase [Anaerolineae bacterium]
MQKYLYFTIFISGMVSLAVEMSASRLLGNVFGTSNLVWASIIGLILIYLAAGYFIGGAWADRSPHPKTFFRILFWAAVLTAVVPVISRPVLRFAANAFDELQLGMLLGSFLAVILLLAVPVTLLGTASPFAIRLSINDEVSRASVGRISGRIYAISTMGSFIGTFLPGLVLIPTIGTYRTFLVIAGMLLIVSIIGIWRTEGWKTALFYLWAPVLLIVLLVLGFRDSDKASTGQIYETESAYNYIQVLQQDGYTMLRLNEGQGIHSVYAADVVNYFGPWEQVLVAPFFNPPGYSPDSVERLAIVGLAAGTTARQASLVYGDIAIDGFEIDPKIVTVGREYFMMNEPNLDVHVTDGRWGLEHSPYRYDIISIDAYRPPYIPAHLTTQEFFQIAHEHLTDDGMLVVNVGRAPNDRRLVNALTTTILTRFADVHIVDVPNSFNSIIFASIQPTSSDNLKANYAHLATQTGIHPLLLETMVIAIDNLQPSPEATLVFTDDRAPVEWITNNMVIRFLLSPSMEALQ